MVSSPPPCTRAPCADGSGGGRRCGGKLGDADNPRYIVTEPRVGYRMAKGETSQPEES